MSKINNRFSTTAGIAIGPILFVVAILAVLVGALAAGSGGFGSSTADDANRVNASTLIQQGTSIKSAFDRILVNGALPSEVVVSTTFTSPVATNAVFAPNGGGLTPQSPPGTVVPTTGHTNWRFSGIGNIPGIGSAGDNDYVAVIGVRTEAICKALNSVIFGKTATQATTVPASLTSAALVDATCTDTTSATATTCVMSGSVFDASAITGVSGRTQACVSDGVASPNTKFFYYQVLTAG